MKFGKYSPNVSMSIRGGWQYIFKFKNGYGASIIKNWYSRGGPGIVTAAGGQGRDID